MFLYGFFRGLFLVIFRMVFRTQIIGRERVPRNGGLLLVANHISFADPPLLGVAMPRRIEFMAMVEIFRKPVLAFLARGVGCFPVDRTKVDHTAAREAVRRLRAGRCVAIFPEGGIRLTQKSVLGGAPELRPGAETIAQLGHAAILPVIIRDSRKPYVWRNWLRRETMSVTFGQPFCLWKPDTHDGKADFFEVVRAQLLKTVELK
jgi:1-acyl-sn-glycerol-3-phosphate acyltransferase